MMAEPGKPFERLPTNVVPKHYAITLTPDLKNFIFKGNVSINVEVLQETDRVVLNAIELEICSTVLIQDDRRLSASNIRYNEDDEKVELVFDTRVTPGNYVLTIDFNGILNDKMKGFYRSKYNKPTGEETYAAVTQFESTDARRCFPCWDEPAIKATFDISLIVPKHLVALSNMPLKLSTPMEDNIVKNDYETTPIMSTYLVAVVVGEYDYVEDKSSDGVLVRVYTPPGKKEQGRFALEVAVKVLPFYKDYFQIAYPLPKIDLIAIADFSAGAMENWGLVTYRETCLLVDPEHTSSFSKQWVALVVGHEIAHQWFGNLVTMEWWTCLWLNEGYASFTEYLCVDHLFPEYDIWTQFVSETYIRALELDGLKNSHPVEVPVQHPSEIDEIFDDISYNKGASVIRMLHQYIGDADFRKGMNLYLTKHQYKNTATEDLWDAFEKACGKPVREVMDSWIKQMGFPVISVEETQEEGQLKLKLSQSKFSSDGVPDVNNTLWKIPIVISSSRDPKTPCMSIVLDEKSTEITIPNIGKDDWVKVNLSSVGYYRTRYTSTYLNRFVSAIKNKTLPPLDRLGLIDDLFAMVQSGHSKTADALQFMMAYEEEDDFTVWSTICNCLDKLEILLSSTDFHDNFKIYKKKLLSKVYSRVGWSPKDGEKHVDTLLRSLILQKMVLLDNEETIAEARKRFELHIGPGPTLPADLRTCCYKAVLRAGDKTTYDTMLKLYRATDLSEEKDRISRALGAIKDEVLLNQVLEFSMSNEVRNQDTVFVVISVSNSKVGRNLAWKFFQLNYDEFRNRYKGGYLLNRLIKSLCENFVTDEMAVEVETFFDEKKSAGSERSVQQAVENIRLNAAWLKRDFETTNAFLQIFT